MVDAVARRALAIVALTASAASATPVHGARPFAPRDRVFVVAPNVRAPRLGRVLRPDLERGMNVHSAPTSGMNVHSASATRPLPDGWHAHVDADTNVPAWLWGHHATPGAIGDAAIAASAARAFLAAHVDVLAPGSSPDDFELVANRLDNATRTVGFRQRASQLPVIGGQIGFVFQRDTLFAITDHALPDVRAVVPRAPSSARVDGAASWLRVELGIAVATAGTRERAILPIVHGSGDIDYYVVDVVDVAAVDTPERWDVYVSAIDGAPVARARTVASATTLVYNAGVRYASGARADFPAPAANITVGASATTTADDGTFACTSATTLVPGLSGPRATVVNMAGSAAMGSLPVTCDQPVEWSFASDPESDAQLSTFIYAGIVKARARRILPSLASWLDTPVNFFVNTSGSTCNAFSTGNDTYYYAGDSRCENTGRIADVIFHEFGHSIHNHAFIPGVGAYEVQLSEGLADFDAVNITEDAGVARGIYYDDTPLRDVSVLRRWPEDISFDPHDTGRIVSGALWDLRRTLIAQLGHDPGVAQIELIFAGVLQRAGDIPSSYMAALVADTTDGNPMDAPHFCAIQRAFGPHGLVPGYVDLTIATPAFDGTTLSVATSTPTGTPCPPHQIASITATYTIDGGAPQTLALAATGDTWAAALPPLPDRSVLRYRVVATLDDGTTRVLPDNAADPMYEAYVGATIPIWCERFSVDPKWTQQTNISGVTEWSWAMPDGTNVPDQPPAPYDGTHVWGMAFGMNGGTYHANEATSTQTPAIDVSSFRQVRLQYRRWLTVEDATYDHATIAVDGTTIWTNAASLQGTLDHLDREWRFHDLDVTSYVVGGSAQIAWSLQSDSSNQFGGWSLDDVCLVGLDKTAKCGDGFLDPDEQCDDGADNGKDGVCSASCTYEIHASGGCAAGGDGGGLALLGACGILVAWGRRSRPRSPARSRSRR
jgi:cysteine-rich repeat protein